MQKKPECVAGIGKTDEDGITGVGYAVPEDRLDDSPAYDRPGLVVGRHTVADIGRVSRKRPEAAIRIVENSMFYQPVERLIQDLVRRVGDLLDPVIDGTWFGITDYGCEYRVEEIVSHWCCILHHKRVESGVDTGFEVKVCQHGAGQHARQIPTCDRFEIAAVFVEQEKYDFFGQSHPRLCP